jgi:hypothetical protein
MLPIDLAETLQTIIQLKEEAKAGITTINARASSLCSFSEYEGEDGEKRENKSWYSPMIH